MKNDPLCPDCGAKLPTDSDNPVCLTCVIGGTIRYFGDYELLGELGRGGMGVVYRARQISLNRLVAVKTMRTDGPLASHPEGARRFRNEAEAAASLDHPNIVPVYEVGTHDGFHFLSMKLIEGVTLADWCSSAAGAIDTRAETKLDTSKVDLSPNSRRSCLRLPREIASALSRIARAVHFAHQRGVLHRDLKPANILVDHAGEVYVTDFGVAKLMNADSQATATGQILGTPAYMAPEQALGAQRSITTAADVYSLGAILYQSLAGQPPFGGETPVEVLRRATSEEPIPLRQLVPDIDIDLATICHKCLQKSPEARYLSAEALADDLDRWSRGEPIQARPIGAVERMLKWINRNRIAAVGIGTVTLSLLVGLMATLWQRDQAVAQAKIAQHNAKEARLRLQETHELTDEMQLRTACQFVASEAQPEALAHLAQILRRTPNHLGAIRWTFNLLQSRGWSGPPLMSLQHTGAVAWVEFSPDGSRLASVGIDSTVRLWDPRSGAPIGLPFRPSGEALLTKIAFAPNGSRLVTSFTSALGQDTVQSNTVFFHNALTGQQMARIAAPYRRRAGADFSIHQSGGELLLSFQAPHVEVWDLERAQRTRTVAHQEAGVEGALYSPDATRFLTMDTNCLVRVWDTATGHPVGTQIQHSSEVWSLYQSDLGFEHLGMAQFSQNGKWILTHSIDNALRLWDAESGLPFGSRMESAVRSLLFGTFSPDGTKVLGWDMSSRDIETWITETTTRTNSIRMDCPSGASRASQVVNPPTLTEQSVNQGFPEGFPTLGYQDELWCPSSSRFAAVVNYCEELGDPFSIGFQLADLQESKVLQQGQPYWSMLPPQLSPDGGTLLATHPVSGIMSIDLRKNQARGWPLRPAGRCFGAWCHPSGHQIATASEAGVVDLWRVPPSVGFFNGLPRKHWSWAPPKLNESADRVLAPIGRGQEGEVWDFNSSRLLARFGVLESAQDNAVSALIADGRYVVGGLSSPPLRVWEAGTGQAVGTILNYTTNAVSVQVNHDASQAMIQTRDGQLELWDQRRGTRILIPESDGFRASTATLSDAGNLLVAADASELLIWQIGSTVGKPRRIRLDGWRVDAISCSPKGDQVVIAQRRLDTSVRRLLLCTPDAAQPFHAWDGLEAHALDAFTWSGRGGLLLARSDHAFWVIHLRDRSVVRKLSPNIGNNGGAAFDPEEKVLWILERQWITPYDVHTLAPSGPPMQAESIRCGISLTRDGKHLVLSGNRDRDDFFLMALPPQSTVAPPWLADLAELAAGLKLGTNRLFEAIPPKGVADGFARLRNVAASSDEGRWLHWYTDRSEDRKISPWRELSEMDYVGRLVAEGNERNLEEALLLAPEDTLIWDKLASVLEAKKEDPESAFRARVFRERISRRGTKR